MKVIKVNLSQNPYSIYIEPNLFEKIPSYLKSLNVGNFAIFITSKSVYSCYRKKIQAVFANYPHKVIILCDGEEAKTKESLFKIIQEIIAVDKLSNKVFVVCLGGGTVGDVGGFAASIYKRGIPYIQIPTSLLSQIDASIGGKCAIDLKEAKNIIGAFYQPRAVFIDPVFLKTLRKKQIKEGLAEVIKYAVIKDATFFNFLKNKYAEIYFLELPAILKIIGICVSMKAKIVEDDEKEKKGIRTILNFGHTFAHALEAASKYKKVSHGEAVALGMLYAAYVSYKLNLCKMNEVYEIYGLLKKFDLTTKIKYNFVNIYRAMTYDKKNLSGKFRLVLLQEIGKVKVVDSISEKIILKTLKEFSNFVCWQRAASFDKHRKICYIN